VKISLGQVDWLSVPAEVDPARGGGLGGKVSGDIATRAIRKRLQVESFVSVLRGGMLLPKGATVVDFGSGSGNLTLPLAYLFPDCTWWAVDFNSTSIDLLLEKAAEARLSNVKATCGTIEEFVEDFDVCVALHVCGAGTDAAMIKAIDRQAVYVASPCCIGKLQSSLYEAPQEGVPSAGPQRQGGVGLIQLSKRGLSPSLTHPRSSWMRSHVSRAEFNTLASAADYSGHTGVSGYDPQTLEGRVPRFAKSALEADRNAASREFGYKTKLMKLLYPQACVRNDLLIGYPSKHSPLENYINSPNVEWGDEN